MKPNKDRLNQGIFFKPWLNKILNPANELFQLANKIDWKTLEDQFEVLFVENRGAPAKSVRLVVGLMMLQNIYDFSDEGVVDQWVETSFPVKIIPRFITSH